MDWGKYFKLLLLSGIRTYQLKPQEAWKPGGQVFSERNTGTENGSSSRAHTESEQALQGKLLTPVILNKLWYRSNFLPLILD